MIQTHPDHRMLKKRLKPVYLLFLALPLLYLLLGREDKEAAPSEPKHSDYFFFSARTSQAVRLSFKEGGDSLASWDLQPGGFRDIEFLGSVGDSLPLELLIEGLNPWDSAVFTGFNCYREQRMVSLFSAFSESVTLENAELAEKDGALTVIAKQGKAPVRLSLKPWSSWEEAGPPETRTWWIVLVFFIGLVVMLIFAPPVRYSVFAVLTALTVMMVLFNVNPDRTGEVSVCSETPLRHPEIFFHDSPFFTPAKRVTSEGQLNTFRVPVMPEKARFLRFDLGDSLVMLRHPQIRVSTGFLYRSYDLAEVPRGALVLNDLKPQDGSWLVTGRDPYVKLTSAWFIRSHEDLIFFERNLFLLLTLIVFVLLVMLHRFMGSVKHLLDQIRFRWSFLFFLLIPATYLFIDHYLAPSGHTRQPDQFYFSAGSSRPARFILYNGNDSVTCWDLNSAASKYFQYSGPIDRKGGLWLKINRLSSGDTLSLGSCNYFHAGEVFSVLEPEAPWGGIRNATKINDDGTNAYIVNKTTEPVILRLMPFDLMQKERPEPMMNLVLWGLFLLVFILILSIAPRSGYLVTVCVISSLLMFLYSWLCRDLRDQVTFRNKEPVKSVQFYYSNNPSFTAGQIVSTDQGLIFFKSNMDLLSHRFLRVDVAESTRALRDVQITTKTGLIRENFDLSRLPAEQLLMNDMVRDGDQFKILGDDPYFVLTAQEQLNRIDWQMAVKQKLFLFLTLFCVVLFLLAGRFASKNDPVAFFLSGFFVLLVSSGLLLHLFSSEGLVLSAEMRYTNPRPVPQLDSSLVFVRQLDDYIKDQIPGRNNMVIMNNLVEFSIFRELLNNPNVHFGKDGWMFYIGGICRENYENRYPLTPYGLEKIKKVLVARRDWLKARGIRYYLVFPVMAYTVYEENVGPRLWRYHKQSKLDQLLEYLKTHTDLEIIDIQTSMMEAKKSHYMDLFFRNNSHWNHYGGYVAYRAMIGHIRKDFPVIGPPMKLNSIEWVHFDTYKPDLYVLTALDQFVDYYEVKPFNRKLSASAETTYPYYPELKSPAPAYCFHNNSIPDNPSVLMYGDSYGGFLLYYLTYNFSHTYYLFTPIFYPSIIEKEKPDLVIQEMADYKILEILKDNPPLPEMKDTLADTERPQF